MSLLMEALKRAEKSRQKNTKAENHSPTIEAPLTLTPMETVTVENNIVPTAVIHQENNPIPLSLEPIQEIVISPPKHSEQTAPEELSSPIADDSFVVINDRAADPLIAVPASVQAPLSPEKTNNPQQNAGATAVPPSSPNNISATPTPAQAAVLIKAASKPWRWSARHTKIFLSMLAATALLSGGWYFYYVITSLNHTSQTAMKEGFVAPSPLASAAPTEVIPPPSSDIPATINRVAAAPVLNSPSPPLLPTTQQLPPTKITHKAIPKETLARATTVQPPAQLDNSPMIPLNLPTKSLEEDATENNIAAQKPILQPSLLNKDELQQQLLSAYQSFQRDDLVGAENKYQAVLNSVAQNRDAWLGLAAIALRQKNYLQAKIWYEKILQLNPKDTVAAGSLANIDTLIDPIAAQAKIKLLLAEDPTNAQLYFYLGTSYTQQSRWAEAREVFMRAYRATPNNADYIYNLAVTLDHLSEKTSALNFYEQALALSSGQPINFDVAQLRLRINQLRGLFEKPS